MRLANALLMNVEMEPYFFEMESLSRRVDTDKITNQGRHIKFYLKSRDSYLHDNEARFHINNSIIKLFADTKYPWNGKVKIKLECEDTNEFGLWFRIPSCCEEFTVTVNDVSLSSLTHLLMDAKPARYMTSSDLNQAISTGSALLNTDKNIIRGE